MIKRLGLPDLLSTMSKNAIHLPRTDALDAFRDPSQRSLRIEQKVNVIGHNYETQQIVEAKRFVSMTNAVHNDLCDA